MAADGTAVAGFPSAAVAPVQSIVTSGAHPQGACDIVHIVCTGPSGRDTASVPVDEFRLITLPVLILHGTLDKATRPSAVSSFTTRRSTDKTLKLYEGHFHDSDDVDKKWWWPISSAGSTRTSSG